MLTSLQKMIGLPVIWLDRQVGFVERAVPNAGNRRLSGIVVRRGLGSAKWAATDAIVMIGKRCVLLRQKPGRMPDGKEGALTRAYLTTGECVGEVADLVIAGETLRVMALEVSGGPFYRLMGQRAYAADYRVCDENGRTGEVVVPKLMTWAELEQELGEEDNR